MGGEDIRPNNGVRAALYRLEDGELELVGGTESRFPSNAHACTIWADSPDDVWISANDVLHYDGISVRSTGAPAMAVWGADADTVLLGFGDTVRRTEGDGFDRFQTGIRAEVEDLSGTSASRVFGVTSMHPNRFPGFVFRFDGLGFTQEPIPHNDVALQAVAAAPTGEVFAVGTGGTIFKGVPGR